MEIVALGVAGGRFSLTLIQEDDSGWQFVSWHRRGIDHPPLPGPPPAALQVRFVLRDEAVAYFERLVGEL